MSIQTAIIGGMTAAVDRTLCSRGRPLLSILIYHQVLRQPDFMRPDAPTAAQFDWQMALLSRYFTPLSLRDGLARLAAGTLPHRAVCVTFDDGYLDNLEVALPILKRWGIPATVFVATAFLERGVMWNDFVIESVREAPGDILDLEERGFGRHAIGTESERHETSRKLLRIIKPMSLHERDEIVDLLVTRSRHQHKRLMMDTAQLRRLSGAGVDIGAHTHSHPILTSLAPTDAKQEIEISKSILENALQQRVSHFAYPNGRPDQDYMQEHVEMVKRAGFEAAVSTRAGVAGVDSDWWQLPRFTPWDRTADRFLLRLLLSRRVPRSSAWAQSAGACS